jgi:flagellar biosynthesis protein FliR
MTLDLLASHWVPVYLLLLARCGGVVAFAPVFGSAALPRIIRAGLAACLALVLTPVVGNRIPIPQALLGMAAALCGELAIGAVLGLAVRLLFAGISMASEMAAVQMGIGLPAALDPHSLSQVSSVSNLVDQIAVLTFLVVGGHHALLAALAQSLTLAPPLSVSFRGTAMEYLLGLFGAALTVALRLAAPVGAALLAMMVTLGLLNRVAPQVNVFMVSFPLTLGVGLLVFLAALPMMISVMSGAFQQLPVTLSEVVMRVRHGL